MKKISIIVPCYNEEDCLLDFDAKLSEVVGQMGIMNLRFSILMMVQKTIRWN